MNDKQNNNKNIKKLEKERNIYFFDIDETLFHTYAKILVKDKKTGEITKSLSNQEFNGYKLEENEEFDFREFKSASKFTESSPIMSSIEKLKKIQKNVNNEVYLLTARANFDNPKLLLEFFKSYGINVGHKSNKGEIHILRSGELSNREKISTEEAKFRYVKDIILEKKDVKKQNLYFFDDYVKNVSNMVKIANDFEISKNHIVLSYRGDVVQYGETVQHFSDNNIKHITNIKDRNYIKLKYNNIFEKKEIDILNEIIKNISYKIYDFENLNSFLSSVKHKISNKDYNEISKIVITSINFYLKDDESFSFLNINNENEKNLIKNKYNDKINVAKINNILNNISYKIYDKEKVKETLDSIKSTLTIKEFEEINKIINNNVNLYMNVTTEVKTSNSFGMGV